jgi:hypothetical protein
MPIVPGSPRLLVKASWALTGATLALDEATVRFTAQPLFTSIGQSAELGTAPSNVWHILEPEFAVDDAKPWDLCHKLLETGLGVAGGDIEFAEPDFKQSWVIGTEADLAFTAARSCEKAAPQDDDFPHDSNNDLWFRDSGFAQFDTALAQLGDPQDRVRVAHLDTGYDPSHNTRPVYLNTALQRNFVEGNPSDATDRSDGLVNNLGHGTGTLSILAGNALADGKTIGAAPFAEVIPVRVANSVVLFYNSAIAKAFDYVHGLNANPITRVHVVTMSMGGLASQAWAEAVNALYDAGVFVVTAAGNNFGNLPTRHIVYPARFKRVVAACGVMADHKPYADLGIDSMAGNYGPSSKMVTAISAYTPNTPWAKFGCADIIDHDGRGTSAATPQIAGAAAIWIQQNLRAWNSYSKDWMRVEAVRKALFDSAPQSDRERLGWGEIKARDALDERPAAESDLRAEKADSVSFPILRTLTGLGIDNLAPARRRMLELEALQLSQSAEIEEILPDLGTPPESISSVARANIVEALISHPSASRTLRDALTTATTYPSPRPPTPPVTEVRPGRKHHLELAMAPKIPEPTSRRLRVYAYDPSLETRLETMGINRCTLGVQWEELKPGPVGEYLEVIDVDPASRCAYAPIDLDDVALLARDGLAPTESNPQFHQQMVYAVAMTTIAHFERALGRVALWSPRLARAANGKLEEQFVPQLRIYPHALRQANAFYSPDRKALLFGYFTASQTDSGDVLPGGSVFSALSHDIIAHETTHALLDGLHRRFREPTNPDVLAFHEAFADIVALFQHFTIPEALKNQIVRTRGDLGSQNFLAQLAVEFGQATGRYGALRDAIGRIENNKWRPGQPNRNEYKEKRNGTGPHELGSVLVAAVFDAFLQIYNTRSREYIQLATGGTGELAPGQIPPALVDRLAREAQKVASQVLGICIRALDYCPPFDLTFGEYLRALVTADRDLVPDDKRMYRVAFISAFRARGIYPSDVRSLAPDSLVWESPPPPPIDVKEILKEMILDWDLKVERKNAYDNSRSNAWKMHNWLMDQNKVSDLAIETLGLSRKAGPQAIGDTFGNLHDIEVHSVRPARRVGPDGQQLSDLVVEITQKFELKDGGSFRGGCTLLIDLQRQEVKYLIRKRFNSEERLEAQLEFEKESIDHLRATYFADPDQGSEPFALLHGAIRRRSGHG